MHKPTANHWLLLYMGKFVIMSSLISLVLSLIIVTILTDMQWHRYTLAAAYDGPNVTILHPIGTESEPAAIPPRPASDDSSPNRPIQQLTEMTIFDRLANLTTLLLSPATAQAPIALQIDNDTSRITVIIDQTVFQGDLKWFVFTRLTISFALFALLSIAVVSFDYLSMVKPSRDMIKVINQFSHDPTIAQPVPESLRVNPDFIAAGRALEELQQNTLLALRQRERLADIGEAVAKISHDIRNALSSATLLTEALLSSPDERVQRSAPYVVQSLEQAVDMCQSMLDYLTEQPVAKQERIHIQKLAADLAAHSAITITTSGTKVIYADHQLMTRILLNLVRNAASAGATEISIDVWKVRHLAVIDIADNGPGIAPDLWAGLFMAFKNQHRGGSGLGLAIARDLAVAQGGNLKLSRSTPAGSEFRIQLPARVLDASS